MNQINDAIHDLAQAYQEFKQTSDQRIAQLEEKTASTHRLEEKLNQLATGIERCSDKVGSLSFHHLRPDGQKMDAVWRAEDREQKQAFKDYICSGDDRALLSLERKGLSTTTNEDGGFSVPQVVVERIREQMDQLSPLRRLAQTLVISSSAVDLLVDYGHAEVGWVQEVSTRAETTTPQLRKLTIPVHEMYANPRASQKLLDDAVIDIESWLVRSIAVRMAQMENLAFINGDGDHKPRGFLSYPSQSVGQGSHGIFEHIHAGDASNPPLELMGDLLMETVEALNPMYHKGAVWLMSRSMFAMIRKIKDAQGHYLLQQSMHLESPPSLLGYPIEISEDMPVFRAGQSSTLAFGNFKETYQIVDRANMQLMRDPFTAKPHVEFYATKRVGGDVINFDSLKLLKFIHA